jgi:predicted nucleotidyltransferase
MAHRIFPDEAALADFCRRNGIRRLSLFGSRLRGTARPDSDIDLLVEFEPGRTPGLLGIAGMEIELSEMLGNKVDLRTAGDLSRYIRDEVVRTANFNMPPDDRDRLRHMISSRRPAADTTSRSSAWCTPSSLTRALGKRTARLLPHFATCMISQDRGFKPRSRSRSRERS